MPPPPLLLLLLLLLPLWLMSQAVVVCSLDMFIPVALISSTRWFCFAAASVAASVAAAAAAAAALLLSPRSSLAGTQSPST
jgi:hypothetical protein